MCERNQVSITHSLPLDRNESLDAPYDRVQESQIIAKQRLRKWMAPSTEDRTLKRLKISHLEEYNCMMNCLSAGSYGQQNDQQSFVKEIVPDADQVFVQLSSHGQRSVNDDNEERAFNDVSNFKINKGSKLTPLEEQVVVLKRKYPNVILFVECGYNYRFFGEDAEIAAKELNIISRIDHNFLTCSIPVFRLHVHIRRLVSRGYKVGVVKQTETAALKAAGSNKSTPFTRELSGIYSRSTMIGEDIWDEDCGSGVGGICTLMVLTEVSSSSSDGMEKTFITIVTILPSTGDIKYDQFDDTLARTVLCSRLEHIQPVEVIISPSVSDLTKKFIVSMTIRFDNYIHIETLNESSFEYAVCLENLCQLFESQYERIESITTLPHDVICCLGAMQYYLKEFKLEQIMNLTNGLRKYSSDCMRLPGTSLFNLDILNNSSDGKEKGSLLSVLNHTRTKYGARILRQWLLYPLLNFEAIKERQDSVEEFLVSDFPFFSSLKNLLVNLPDFEKTITNIFVRKCSPQKFWKTVSGLYDIHVLFSAFSTMSPLEGFSSTLSQRLFFCVLNGLSDMKTFVDLLDENSAMENRKTTLLKDWSEFENVNVRQNRITEVEKKLDDLKEYISEVLSLPSFSYITVSTLEYLIEVRNDHLHYVPSSWIQVNMTKTCTRFRSPEIEKLYAELKLLREELHVHCHQAWLDVLDKFSVNYITYKEAIKCLGMLDVLLSLAEAAKCNNYVRPKINQNPGVINIIGGMHPIVSQYFSGEDQFVANDTHLNIQGKRIMLLTGPNMGGKSCYIRQVALLAVMTQIGSFVPAQSAELSIFDGIYTRMSVLDEIFTGRSTFMIEVEESADILNQATNRSIVIMDEFGCGTSTHDGLAVAMATFEALLLKICCLTIFVTHHLTLTEFEQRFPEFVSNYHMAFFVAETDSYDVRDRVTFLYQLMKGYANKSYGLNVAHLAGLPTNILEKALEKSLNMKYIYTHRRKKLESFKSFFKSKFIDNIA